MNPLDWSLVDGWLPVGATIAGLLAVVAIAASRSRSWWPRVVPVTVTSVTLLVAGVVFFVDPVWCSFPAALPPTVTVWIGVAVLALALAVIRCWTLGWRGRTAALVAAGLDVVVAAEQANAYFSAYPTLRAAMGMTTPDTPFEKVAAPAPKLVEAGKGQALSDVWRPPPGTPESGTVSEASIPSSRGFGGFGSLLAFKAKSSPGTGRCT